MQFASFKFMVLCFSVERHICLHSYLDSYKYNMGWAILLTISISVKYWFQ